MKKIQTILLIYLVTLFYAQNALAQFVNNGQTIVISPNTEVSMSGAFVNKGEVINEGNLLIQGDWQNEDTYSGQGTVVLNGEKTQVINHNGGSFHNLVLDGDGEKILAGNASISGELYLKDGVLSPESSVVFLIKDKGYVSNGSADSYINGRLFHEGTGKKYYPLGKDGNFKPVELVVAGDQPVTGLELFVPNPHRHHAHSIIEVSPKWYLEKTVLSGKLSGQTTLTLPVGNDGLEGAINQLVIAGAAKTDKIFHVMDKPRTSGFMDNGTISSNVYLGSDYFALALLEDPENRLLYVPNAFAPFSPKANNEDKVVKVYGPEISSEGFLFRIYNRWGKVVYQTTSYEEASQYGWTGIDQKTGKLQSFGAYRYILKGKFNSGKPIDLAGNIHLIR